MSNIFSVKYMNEGAPSLSNKVLKTPVRETYLYSTLKALNEMNNEINEATKTLYINIAEAESKEDENKIFAEYFYQFKNTFQNFRNKVEEMKSRLIINVENKVETWKDIFKDDNCGNFENEFTYSGHKFYHLDDSCYPRFNLYKLYQKEFDYIGRLMQDKSNMSPTAKLQVIASVSNNFINYTANKDWIKSMIRDMVDVDNKEIHGSYSECIYNSLRDKYDMNVDKGVLYTCRENLCDYEDVINANIKMCDDLLRDLDKVATDISSYLFRNQDKKLKIKTPTDGVIDRDYRLDTYCMNELDLFLKNKVNQVKKVLNIYAIAIGIKFDTIVEYIDQNIDILRTATMNDEYTETDNDPSYADTDDDGNIDDEFDDDNKDYTHGDVGGSSGDDFEFGEDEGIDDDIDFADNDMADDWDEPIEEDDSGDDFGDDSEDVEDNSNEEDNTVDGGSGNFEEAYLFPSQVFEMELMFESYNLYEMISEEVLMEADATDLKGQIKFQRDKIKEIDEKIKQAEKDMNSSDEATKKKGEKERIALSGTRSAEQKKLDTLEKMLNSTNKQQNGNSQSQSGAKTNTTQTSGSNNAQSGNSQPTNATPNPTATGNPQPAKTGEQKPAEGTNPAQPQNTKSADPEGDDPAKASNKNLKALANREKDTLWRRIMAKLAELWKKFKEKVFGDKTKEKTAYLTRNKAYINYTFEVPEGSEPSMQYTPNFKWLPRIQIPDLDYGSMTNVLEDRDEFEKKYFNDFVKDGGDLTENMKTFVLGEEQQWPFQTTIQEAYDFCVDYPKKVNTLQKQSEVLDRAQRAARDDIDNVKESAYINNGFEQYFMEFDGKNDDTAKGKKDNVNVYFQVCSQVLTTQMNIYESLYNEMYKYCTWYIGRAKTIGKAPAGSGGEQPQTQEGQAQQGEQKNQGGNNQNITPMN